MKSSTLHRAGLSQERMFMLERAKRNGNAGMDEIPQYRQSWQNEQSVQETKVPELDVLYKNFQKSLKKPTVKKTPGVYLGIGFALGAITMLILSLIVGLSSMSPKREKIATPKPAQVAAIIPAADKKEDTLSGIMREEKYTIKSGDTLDKIAFRFYGKYDNKKIEKIQLLNGIKSATSLQIGQVIIVPLDR